MKEPITFPVTSLADVENYANRHLNNGRCWVITVCFGTAITSSYASPSRIPYTTYSDTYQFDHRFWRDGQWHSFPAKTIRKYQNTGLGVSD